MYHDLPTYQSEDTLYISLSKIDQKSEVLKWNLQKSKSSLSCPKLILILHAQSSTYRSISPSKSNIAPPICQLYDNMYIDLAIYQPEDIVYQVDQKRSKIEFTKDPRLC